MLIPFHVPLSVLEIALYIEVSSLSDPSPQSQLPTHSRAHTPLQEKSPVAQTIQNCYCPLHISFSLSNGNSLLFYKIRCVLRWHLQPLQLELELMRGQPLRSRLLDKRDRMKQLVISRPFQGEPHTLIIVQFHGDF